MKLLNATAVSAAVSIVVFSAVAADAALVSTNGSLSSRGVAASIIEAPADANDDAAFNDAIQAFNEVQGYTLLGDLMVDGGIIAAGTRVDSHMIFLNSGPGNSRAPISHGAGSNRNAASFTFDGDILGVMSASNGALEVASNDFLGLAATLYPVSPFSARGMEGNPLDGRMNDDWYSVLADTITLGMNVTEPGDWVRVVTVSQVPVPAALPLFLTGLAGLGYAARRRKSA
ncbi:MAG: VPLPA-CTERM sorting domain-containing protein [Pikeienuella sp.]